jgi:RHS repeat-associated protein
MLDAASNISSRTGPSATYTYDTSNRLTGDGGQTFTWSNADRLTARGSDSFGFDPLDRLTTSTVSGTPRTYAYNADGLLQSRTQGGSTTNLLWDPATSPSRLLQVGSDKMVYGLGPFYMVSGSATTTFARDGGKSVRAELSGSGAVTASFRYRAYGAIAQSSGASAPTYLGFASQLLDASGIYYMRARWYDPASGRFLTRDPLASGFNPAFVSNSYGYALANPAGLVDPSGLWPVDDPDVPYWRQVELRVERQLRARYPEDKYEIKYNRAVRDPSSARTLRDETGSIRRPDFQVIDRATNEIVEIKEVGTGSISSLFRKIKQFENYKAMASQIEPRPTLSLEYEVTPSVTGRISGAAGKLFIPLMIFEMLLDIRDYTNSPEYKYRNMPCC